MVYWQLIGMNRDRLIEELEDQTAVLTLKMAYLFREAVTCNIDHMSINYMHYRQLRKQLSDLMIVEI